MPQKHAKPRRAVGAAIDPAGRDEEITAFGKRRERAVDAEVVGFAAVVFLVRGAAATRARGPRGQGRVAVTAALPRLARTRVPRSLLSARATIRRLESELEAARAAAAPPPRATVATQTLSLRAAARASFDGDGDGDGRRGEALDADADAGDDDENALAAMRALVARVALRRNDDDDDSTLFPVLPISGGCREASSKISHRYLSVSAKKYESMRSSRRCVLTSAMAANPHSTRLMFCRVRMISSATCR